MSNVPDTEIVKVVVVDPDTGIEIGEPSYGVAAGDNFAYTITRSAATLEDLREEVGDLHDPRTVWQHALTHDEEPLGDWLEEWDEDGVASVPTAADTGHSEEGAADDPE